MTISIHSRYNIGIVDFVAQGLLRFIIERAASGESRFKWLLYKAV